MISKVVCDWLPAILGLAITAGIAPLLFVQILYKHQFYTANLLLFNRFMLLLPALIVAYYMLYLVRSHASPAGGRSCGGGDDRRLRLLLLHGMGMDGKSCLEPPSPGSGEDPVHFSCLYLSQFRDLTAALGYWITASFTTLAVAVAWRSFAGAAGSTIRSTSISRLARLRSLAILGLAMSAAELLGALARHVRPGPLVIDIGTPPWNRRSGALRGDGDSRPAAGCRSRMRQASRLCALSIISGGNAMDPWLVLLVSREAGR